MVGGPASMLVPLVSHVRPGFTHGPPPFRKPSRFTPSPSGSRAVLVVDIDTPAFDLGDDD
jgi:hypothetical protein